MGTHLMSDNKFKTSDGTHLLTQALFIEKSRQRGGDTSKALYTLQDEDIDNYQSLYRLYMEMGDLTEYEFALTYFYNWNHWKRLCLVPWFLPHVTRWREELDLKTKSEAIKRIKEEAKDPKGKNTFSANKVLIDRAWEKSAPKKEVVRTVGRPSNEEVVGELKRQVESLKAVDADYERIIGKNK